MKDVLLLHDNARPHTALQTREAMAKVGCTVLPHSAHSPDPPPSDHHMFGPVSDALRGHHFADDNELKQSFRDVLLSRGREFHNTGIQRLTQHWQSVLKMTKTLWKDSFVIAKYVLIINVNFIAIAIAFSEKRLEALFLYDLSYMHIHFHDIVYYTYEMVKEISSF
jgi:hypothetical protein